ncbi:hypothetical protein [Azospirillum rugosum]|uniref:Uncharacterized protein n=1 Tax=Azospirillum rugosum TaxID=416170 RepID=A0ABS4SP12_9PROT|nr:hypothetical protein [Azospirillum rugosum]MBP2294294.1 hypothetical protein [Azospirillum rugosum]MDQ0527629.1 hypothetical protein [Azospirillum rugosum]
MVYDLRKLRAHADERFSQTFCTPFPAPHLYLHNVFPYDYYNLLIENWPSEHFAPIGSDKCLGMYFKPFVPLAADATGQIARLPDGQREFWGFFRDFVQSYLYPWVFLRLGDAVTDSARQYSREPKSEHVFSMSDFEVVEDELVARRSPHHLAPHIDNLLGLITILIYMPSDADHQHLGTRLYAQQGAGRPKMPSELPTPYRAQYASALGISCVEAKRIPFAPNTLVAFVNAPNAWHGQYLDEDYERRGYQCFLGARKDLLGEIFDPESTRLLIDNLPGDGAC